MGDGPVKYALAPSANRLLRKIDPIVGAAFLAVRPKRARALMEDASLAGASWVDRSMVAALVARHERQGTLGELSCLHRQMWAGPEGLKFHTQAEKRFRTWWLENLASFTGPIGKAVEHLGGRIDTLCEIGCGSGLVLNDLPARLPMIRNFVGVDLSPEQTVRNRARFPDPRLRFEAGDATRWIPEFARPGWAYFTNSGVLEYLSERELSALLSVIAARFGPAVFALVEPIADDFDLVRETASRPYNFEKSLGHNYLHHLGARGWSVQHQEERRIEGTRMLMVVASVG